MKKLFFIIGLFLPLINFAQIKFIPTTELGYINRVPSLQDHIVVDNIERRYVFFYYDLLNSMFCDIGIEAKWKKLSVYTNCNTYFQQNTLVKYSPKQMEYVIGGKYQIGIFELRAEHMCSHSVDKKKFNEFYDKVSIKIHFSK